MILRLLTGTDSDLQDLQKVLEGAPGYFRNCSGAVAGPEAARAEWNARPPRGEKHLFGLEEDGELVGCLDLVRGYPEPGYAYVGLLLLREDRQGQGKGRRAWALLEETVRTWPEARRLRLAVLGFNRQALGFWHRLGFQLAGDPTPYSCPHGETEAIHLEKAIAASEEAATAHS